jgi:hypothetical protein
VSDAPGELEPPYHLILGGEEVPATARALRLLIADEVHEPDIRRLAGDVLDGLELDPGGERLTLTLTPQQMKITHSAVRLLLNDLTRDQAHEIDVLRAVLDKLPDEHVMRAIQLE